MSAGSTPAIPEDYHYLIALGTVVYVALRHKLADVERDCFTLYQNGIKEMKEELKETIIGSVQGSIPNPDDYGYEL